MSDAPSGTAHVNRRPLLPTPAGLARASVFACAAAMAFAPALLGGCGGGEPGAPGAAPPVVTTKSGAAMVLLAGGWFEMGSDDPDQTDEPPHRVRVSPFYLDVHEVTQEEYTRAMGTNPSKWEGDRNPVEQIRWTQAAEYCNARSRLEGLKPAYDPKTGQCDFDADGYRLPTEAEWEYAARAGASTRYFFGDSPAALGQYAWFRKNETRGPRPVGRKQPNPWGLYDMYGNVWEWCHDFYDENYYRQGPEKDPRGPPSGPGREAAPKTRVLRGGCWNSRPDMCRSSYRNDEDPGYTDACFGRDVHGFVGFRCARRAPAPGP